jgi:hypothetical protein
MSGLGQPSPKDEWVFSTFGLVMAGAAEAKPVVAKGGGATWQDARAVVLGDLKSLEKAIRAMKDPLGDPAIILVKAIAGNLTASPSTQKQVDELRRYLEGDSIIGDAEAANGFGITVTIRKPLLAALATLEQGLVA